MGHARRLAISVTLALILAAVFFVPVPFAQFKPIPSQVPGGLPGPSPTPLPFPSPSMQPSMTPPPFPSPSPTPTPSPLREAVVPSSLPAPLEEELRRLNQQVSELYQAAKYDEAMPLAQRYVDQTRGLVGDAHPTYAAAISSLSILYRAQGHYGKAEPLILRALAIDETALGPEHLNVGGELDNLAQLYQEQGRYAEAEPLYNRALAIAEKALGPEHPRVGNALNNLAWLYQAQGRYADAEPLVGRALAIIEKAQGPEHADVGRILDTLARLFEGRGQVKEAEPHYRRALAILEKALGPDHPEVAIVRGNFGGLHKSQGRLSEAEPLLQGALATQEKSLGRDHPAVAYSLTQLGDLFRLRGQCEQAEPLFVRALAMSKGDIQEVPVLFGTDRERDSTQPSIAFGAERGKELSLGLAIVTVPKEHMRAPVVQQAGGAKGGTASGAKSERHLAMRCTQIVKDTQLIEAAVRRLGASKTNQAFVFVHGYNSSFDNAVRRAAQIAYDLEFDGGTFLFSWPSRNRLVDYFDDSDTVDLAADHLEEFLEKVVAETKATKIHFVAHSMGNMVLLRALDRVGSDRPALRPAIGEIIHAAPDVDPDTFAKIAKRIKARGANITLYASSSDWALWASGKARSRPRAGFISKESPLIVAGVDTIDITRAGTGLFGLNHDTYSESPTIVGDMRRIIARGERPPDRRTKEFEAVVAKEGGTYWRLRQAEAAAQ
jgi:esterase/lipase superfamily enzyme/Flp pilus assembly protein TadD